MKYHDRFVINQMTKAYLAGRSHEQADAVGHTAARISERHLVPRPAKSIANDL